MTHVESISVDSTRPPRPPLPKALLHAPGALDDAFVEVPLDIEIVTVPDSDGTAKKLRDFLGDVFSVMKLSNWCTYLRAGETKNAREEAAKRLTKLPSNKTQHQISNSSFEPPNPSNKSKASLSDRHAISHRPRHVPHNTIQSVVTCASTGSLDHSTSSGLGTHTERNGGIPPNDPAPSETSRPLPENQESSNDEIPQRLPNQPIETNSQSPNLPENPKISHRGISRKKKLNEDSLSTDGNVTREPTSKVARLSPQSDSTQKATAKDVMPRATLSWEENFKFSILGYQKSKDKAKGSQLSTTNNSTFQANSTTNESSTREIEASISVSADAAITIDVSKENNTSSKHRSVSHTDKSVNGNVSTGEITTSMITTLKQDEDKFSLDEIDLCHKEQIENKNNVLTEIKLENSADITNVSMTEEMTTWPLTEVSKKEPPSKDITLKESLLAVVPKEEFLVTDVMKKEINPTYTPKKELLVTDLIKKEINPTYAPDEELSVTDFIKKETNSIDMEEASMTNMVLRTTMKEKAIVKDEHVLDVQKVAQTNQEQSAEHGAISTQPSRVDELHDAPNKEKVDFTSKEKTPDEKTHLHGHMTINDTAKCAIQDNASSEESVTNNGTESKSPPSKAARKGGRRKKSVPKKSPRMDNSVHGTNDPHTSTPKTLYRGIMHDSDASQDIELHRKPTKEYNKDRRSLEVDFDTESPKDLKQKKEANKKMLDGETIPSNTRSKRKITKGTQCARSTPIAELIKMKRADSAKLDGSKSKQKSSKPVKGNGSQKAPTHKKTANCSIETSSSRLESPDEGAKYEPDSSIHDPQAPISGSVRKRRKRSVCPKAPMASPSCPDSKDGTTSNRLGDEKSNSKSAVLLQEPAAETEAIVKKRRKRSLCQKDSTSSAMSQVDIVSASSKGLKRGEKKTSMGMTETSPNADATMSTKRNLDNPVSAHTPCPNKKSKTSKGKKCKSNKASDRERSEPEVPEKQQKERIVLKISRRSSVSGSTSSNSSQQHYVSYIQSSADLT